MLRHFKTIIRSKNLLANVVIKFDSNNLLILF